LLDLKNASLLLLLLLLLLVLQARDRKSGVVVALKLYRMHKLNDISSHQVAREVRSAICSSGWGHALSTTSAGHYWCWWT
jgi:hypothetical protein